MRALELKVPPPAIAFLVGAAMWFAAQQRFALELPLVVRIVAFVIIALAGGATALAGDLEFKRARTTINPFKPENSTALVTSGIYRFTRNPMYVGLTLVVLGWAAFLCSAWALLGPVIFVLYISRFQIAPEERALSAKFGAAYTEYAGRVRRWL
ncbi:MAG: protein-S-isoprenylcysteine methyltransferase [Proteobacteria bacterium]|nr:MAG: protein-S-isoprenylcysteine methyltransferase [Pseudomonadota bacterium]